MCCGKCGEVMGVCAFECGCGCLRAFVDVSLYVCAILCGCRNGRVLRCFFWCVCVCVCVCARASVCGSGCVRMFVNVGDCVQV